MHACMYIYIHTSSIKITPTAFSSPGKMWPLSNFFSFMSHGVNLFLKYV